LSIWTIKPLLAGGYFPMHDDTQVARVIVMGRALKQGQFPVRWVSGLGYGYGYPIYNFYGPLPYYLGGTLYAIGVDSITATKVMFGAGAILAGVLFYLCFSSTLGTLGAVVGSVLFIYAPYHAVDMYVRGAVGEYWAIAFLPLIVYGFLQVGENKRYVRGICARGGGLAGVILSHTILGFVMTGFSLVGILVYLAVLFFRKQLQGKVALGFLGIVVAGLGLSAFFWLPAFTEMKFTSVTTMITSAPTNFIDHFVCVNQLWDSPWGFGGSAPGCVDGMSFKLGKLQTILSLFGLIAWFLTKNKKARTALIGVGAGVMVFSLIGATEISKPLWSWVPFVSFIQYPWRLLSFTIIGMGILGAYILIVTDKRIFRALGAIGIIGVCIAMNGKIFNPKYLYAPDIKIFESSEDISFRVSKISDEYLPPGIQKPVTPDAVVKKSIDESDTLHIQSLQEKDTYVQALVESAVTQKIQIRKAYFPGWKYFVNDKEVKPTIVLGLPSVIVLEGKSLIVARFTNTPVRVVGNLTSVLFVLVLSFIFFYGKKTIT
jgi:hypothetical protein